MALSRALSAAALATLLAACGKSSAPEPNIEKPFTGWMNVTGMRCADGSPTGIGILPGRSDAVLVYLAGGGACWGDATCNADRSFAPDYFTYGQAFMSGTIFDRALPGNPYADWTWIFIPYCTGDVHAGDTVRDHGGLSWQHHGYRNVQAAVGAITSDFGPPARLAVAGSSAGGFGALVAYGLLRDTWNLPGGTSAELVDDSGPTFVGTATPPALLAAWWDAWGLGTSIGVLCPRCAPQGQGGDGDLSQAWDALHARYPDDRLALLSTTQDRTMRGFFSDPSLAITSPSPEEFEASLATLAGKLGNLGPAVATYRVGGAAVEDHALLAKDSFLHPSFLQSPQGPPLLAWLGAMAAPDPAWTSSTSP